MALPNFINGNQVNGPNLTQAFSDTSSDAQTKAQSNNNSFTGSNSFTNPVTIQGATAHQQVSSIAVLRTMAPTAGRALCVQSYYGDGNGGGGDFYAVTGAAAGTYVDNGGTIIVPTGGDGSSAWLLLHDSTIEARQFGVKFDDVTDDTTAWTNALNYLDSIGGGILQGDDGITVISASLPPKNNVRVEGVFPSATSGNAIAWDEGFTTTGGTRFKFPSGTVWAYNVAPESGTANTITGFQLINMGWEDVGSFITVGDTSQNAYAMAGCTIQNIMGGLCTGVAFDITNCQHMNMRNLLGGNVTQMLRFTSDNDSTLSNANQPGNSHITDVYAFVTSSGNALPTIHLRALDNSGNGRNLNLVVLDGRIQVNKPGATNTSYHIYLEGGTTPYLNGCEVHGIDCEGFAESLVYLQRANNGAITFRYGAATNTGGTATITIDNCKYNNIYCSDNNAILNIINSSLQNTLSGNILDFVSGSIYPQGVWRNTTSQQIQTGVGAVNVLNYSIQSGFLVATSNSTFFLDFSSSLGGVRNYYASSAGASPLVTESRPGFYNLSSSSAVNVSLPDATVCGGLGPFIFKYTGSGGSVTVTPGTAGQTIDGAASNTHITTQYQWLSVMSDGANWFVVGQG